MLNISLLDAPIDKGSHPASGVPGTEGLYSALLFDYARVSQGNETAANTTSGPSPSETSSAKSLYRLVFLTLRVFEADYTQFRDTSVVGASLHRPIYPRLKQDGERSSASEVASIFFAFPAPFSLPTSSHYHSLMFFVKVAFKSLAHHTLTISSLLDTYNNHLHYIHILLFSKPHPNRSTSAVRVSNYHPYHALR